MERRRIGKHVPTATDGSLLSGPLRRVDRVPRRGGFGPQVIARVLILQGDGDGHSQLLSEPIARLELGFASATTLIGQIDQVGTQRW